jgi:hypothetical protein
MRAVVIALLALALAGCGDGAAHTRAVYMMLDTSGTYATELEKAQSIANYLLGSLNSGDSLCLARIDSASFSEKDIIAKVSFDDRPSHANQQKRSFRADLDRFVGDVKGASHTDITGGMLQATEWLRETGAGRRYILIFSDLEEDLPAGHVRDFEIDLTGVQVIALNVTKLRSDQVDPREYLERLDAWEDRVTEGGGTWRVLNDLNRLDSLLN